MNMYSLQGGQVFKPDNKIIYFCQIKVPNKLDGIMVLYKFCIIIFCIIIKILSVGITYSMRDLICDVNYCA